MNQNISWEGHLGGTLMGVILSIVLYKVGPEKPEEELQEETDEVTDEFPYWMEDIPEKTDVEEEETKKEKNEEPTIIYRYVPKNANPWEKDDPV